MDDDGERLRRWLDSGGTVKVLGHQDQQVLLALCTCDGGEVQARLPVSPAVAQQFESEFDAEVAQ